MGTVGQISTHNIIDENTGMEQQVLQNDILVKGKLISNIDINNIHRCNYKGLTKLNLLNNHKC